MPKWAKTNIPTNHQNLYNLILAVRQVKDGVSALNSEFPGFCQVKSDTSGHFTLCISVQACDLCPIFYYMNLCLRAIWFSLLMALSWFHFSICKFSHMKLDKHN